MPVIRTQAAGPSSIAEDVLRRELARELSAHAAEDEPVRQPIIFENEIAADRSVDVTVVWEKWRFMPTGRRASIIVEAYETASPQTAGRIATVVGATTGEAIELGLLPWAVEYTGPAPPGDPAVTKLMLEHGAVQTDAGLVLRLPDRRSAELTHRVLVDRTSAPGYWKIVEYPPVD